MAISFLCLGSNLWDRAGNITKAIELLSTKCSIIKESSIYETKPWGFLAQDLFFNNAIKVSTSLDVTELHLFCKEIEASLGKEKLFLNGPRVIDIDIIFYDDLVHNSDDLVVPHPRFYNRAFNLIPLLEIDDIVHPVLKKKLSELLKECIDVSNVVRLG